MVPRKKQDPPKQTLAFAIPESPRLVGHLIEELHNLLHDLVAHIHDTQHENDVVPHVDANIRVEATGIMHISAAIRHASTKLTRQLERVIRPSMLTNPATTTIYDAIVIFWRGELAAVQFVCPDSAVSDVVENFIMNEVGDEAMREAIRVAMESHGDTVSIIKKAKAFAERNFSDIAVWTLESGQCAWLKHGSRYSPEMLERLDGVAREELSSGGSF